ASAEARCRNKCNLSSRDVKSTGDRFFVVTLPSAVMAKVETTRGRFDFCFIKRLQRPTLNAQGSIQILDHWDVDVFLSHSASPISCSSATTSCSISRIFTRAPAPLGL